MSNTLKETILTRVVASPDFKSPTIPLTKAMVRKGLEQSKKYRPDVEWCVFEIVEDKKFGFKVPDSLTDDGIQRFYAWAADYKIIK